MMDALGVAGDFLADDAGGIVVAHRAAHPADALAVQPFDVERAGAGAVMRANRGNDGDACFDVLGPCARRIGMIVGGHSDTPREELQHTVRQLMVTPHPDLRSIPRRRRSPPHPYAVARTRLRSDGVAS